MAKLTTLEKVRRLLAREGYEEEDYEWYEGYSGRGMFGAVSEVALTTGCSPQSKMGKALQRLGLSCDNMGYDWIYYSR